MVVASGQMPYNYGTKLPIRALPNAWPGIGVPNIGASGDIVEAGMFVLNAELRKWGVTSLATLTETLYTHPDITPSGFEPKARGETLTGLVTGTVGLLAVDNIENMRTLLRFFLLDAYDDDTDYDREDLLEAWLGTAYPESPSGSIYLEDLGFGFATIGPDFLRPPAEHITAGDYIDTDIHWLGGSGVYFDIDVGEVIFNPFPFPGVSQYFAPSTGNHRFAFGPMIPVVQTTAGAIPSVNASRYQSDIGIGSFKATANFQAIESGYVQIDGYALLNETIMELVKGNDNNFGATVTFTNDYTGHVQGIRRVAQNTGQGDPSARCYRLPTAQSSGLYRFITINRKADVPTTAIASGFVSIWPQGRVIKTSVGSLLLSNFIDGQQLTETSDGGMIISPTAAKGLHVMDDAIWVTSPNNSTTPSGDFHSPGLFILSPHNGDLVWYRPAERVLSTSGDFGPGPATFGAHIGLMEIGGSFYRVSKTAQQITELNVLGAEDRMTWTVYFEQYDPTTLDHLGETPVGYAIQSEDAVTASFGGDGMHFALTDGSEVFLGTEFGTVHKFTTGLSFVNAYRGSIARRRWYANGQYLYAIGGNISAGDPVITPITNGGTSGIGVWSWTDPAGTSVDSVGIITHTSAKPLRAEAHVGHQDSARIHHIFDVAGSTHVRNGTWALVQFATNLYLFRIVEEASQWRVVESIKFRDTFQNVSAASVPLEYPIEAILHDID